MKTTIKKWGINGEGIAFHEGKPVFIENAIPEEVIEFDIKRDEDTYLIGEMTRLVEQSSKRRYPLCPIWKECGGCALMHVKYPAQCKMKEGNLKETLIKYADYNGRILPILKNPEPLSLRQCTRRIPAKRASQPAAFRSSSWRTYPCHAPCHSGKSSVG